MQAGYNALGKLHRYLIKLSLHLLYVQSVQTRREAVPFLPFPRTLAVLAALAATLFTVKRVMPISKTQGSLLGLGLPTAVAVWLILLFVAGALVAARLDLVAYREADSRFRASMALSDFGGRESRTALTPLEEEVFANVLENDLANPGFIKECWSDVRERTIVALSHLDALPWAGAHLTEVNKIMAKRLPELYERVDSLLPHAVIPVTATASTLALSCTWLLTALALAISAALSSVSDGCGF